jgi:hypothetical protein
VKVILLIGQKFTERSISAEVYSSGMTMDLAVLTCTDAAPRRIDERGGTVLLEHVEMFSLGPRR